MKTCTNMTNKDFTSGNGWVAKDIECFVVLFASRCLQKRRVNHNIFSNHASIIIYLNQESRSPEKRVAGMKLCERSRVQWDRVEQSGQLDILKWCLKSQIENDQSSKSNSIPRLVVGLEREICRESWRRRRRLLL